MPKKKTLVWSAARTSHGPKFRATVGGDWQSGAEATMPTMRSRKKQGTLPKATMV